MQFLREKEDGLGMWNVLVVTEICTLFCSGNLNKIYRLGNLCIQR
jgi:hypothetical protein